jgi:hypothetical protein
MRPAPDRRGSSVVVGDKVTAAEETEETVWLLFEASNEVGGEEEHDATEIIAIKPTAALLFRRLFLLTYIRQD